MTMKRIGTGTALMVTVTTAAACVVAAAVFSPLFFALPPWQFWLVLLGGACALALIVRLALHRAVDRALREAAHALTLAGAGDHGARLPPSAGALARAFNDMQERLEASRSSTHAALEFQAMHDALTALPNRVLLMDRLSQAIRSAQRNHHGLAFMLADLDHFKEVNDTFGHPCGDIVLREAAARMRSAVRDSDTVARLGGDEFAFLLPTASDAQAMRIAAKIMRAFESPFEIEGNSIALAPSIGVALFPQHGDDAEALIRCADVAMYAAKHDHCGRMIYDKACDRHAVPYLAFRQELRNALAQGEMRLYYQPVIDLASRTVTGAEALARWHHPQRGVLGPDEFIPLAERTGLIRELTLWALETAARHGREWEGMGADLSIAVNLSAQNLHDAGLPETVDRIIAADGGRKTRLCLEITESAVMPGPARALDALNRLSAQGVRISIDDFGTGYSSLAYLKQLPVDELKIDRSFVTGMRHDSDDTVIVRSTIDLAHNIGLRVVAEGVEDQETCDLLASMHCDAAQGYHLARPMDLPDFMDWLRTRCSADGVMLPVFQAAGA